MKLFTYKSFFPNVNRKGVYLIWVLLENRGLIKERLTTSLAKKCFKFQNCEHIECYSVINPFMTEADIIYLLRKSMDWFLYDIGLRHERVK